MEKIVYGVLHIDACRTARAKLMLEILWLFYTRGRKVSSKRACI